MAGLRSNKKLLKSYPYKSAESQFQIGRQKIESVYQYVWHYGRRVILRWHYPWEQDLSSALMLGSYFHN